MTDTALISVSALSVPWQTADPFLFCMYHEDFYPPGNEDMGPDASLQGRQIGNDFSGRDGWRMYHGDLVPGFPAHPHRGFETVTVVRRGLVDHADSLGAAGRYGGGDTQWLTTGRGVQHSEMFPLLPAGQDNTLELFQIWLNLPGAGKMAEPHFAMFWKEAIPKVQTADAAGKVTEIEIIAGALGTHRPLPPPPASWAANPANDVAIWVIRMAPHAQWTLPATQQGSNRSLYYYKGATLRIAGEDLTPMHRIELAPELGVPLVNGGTESFLLLLQGRPINEPVAQYGPFVMTDRSELQQAFVDYQQTQFGGWPWPRRDQVFPRTQGRFARHADGHTEEKGLG
ncbi:MAG: pirin family protein [Gammaproteobacteria bacterium]|nr:pirin family protein [Gammaproteobacteria bacterium]